MVLHFVSMLGGDVSIVPQTIEHYKTLGVDSFLLIRHVEDRGHPNYEAIGKIADDAGVGLFHTEVGPWDEDLNARLIRKAMDEHPDDWYVIADLDEFQVYDRPVAELTELCDRRGLDYVEGCFLDRVARDGSFPEPGTGSLWKRYPLAGMLSMPLLGGTPTKVVLARGRVRLELGQHTAHGGTPLPHRESYAQVHHFKWTGSVVERMRVRKQRFASGEWKLVYPSVVSEVIRFLDHVQAHEGRIDVDEPFFMFQECGSDFGDYRRWDEVLRRVHLHWPAGW